MLQFLARCNWLDSDLDVFAEDGEDYSSMTRYLVENEGYQQTECRDNNYREGGEDDHDFVEACAKSQRM